MLRPEALDTEQPGDYPVRVESVSFRGSGTLVMLRGQDGTEWKKTAGRTVSWPVGTVLQAKLTVERPVLFAESWENG